MGHYKHAVCLRCMSDLHAVELVALGVQPYSGAEVISRTLPNHVFARRADNLIRLITSFAPLTMASSEEWVNDSNEAVSLRLGEATRVCDTDNSASFGRCRHFA